MLLAEQDMRLVVDELAAIEEDERLYSRVVETGLVVTYARAYTLDSERRGLREELYRRALMPPCTRS